MIRALIVDDAPLVRTGIRLFLKEERDIEVVGEACDGPDAVVQMGAYRPDLVFLDVQMPGFDGFEALSRCRETPPQAVIFVTAHADYALRAFDNNAIGYLMKPIEPIRFHEVLDRARLLLRRKRVRGEPDHAEEPLLPGSEALLTAPAETGRPLTRILVKHADRMLLLKAADIDWITATGEYASLHTGTRTFLIRMSLSVLAERLDTQQFVRIHRGTIVNLDRIREIHPVSHGDCDVILHDGQQLRMSRTYRDALLARTT